MASSNKHAADALIGAPAKLLEIISGVELSKPALAPTLLRAYLVHNRILVFTRKNCAGDALSNQTSDQLDLSMAASAWRESQKMPGTALLRVYRANSATYPPGSLRVKRNVFPSSR